MRLAPSEGSSDVWLSVGFFLVIFCYLSLYIIFSGHAGCNRD